MNSLITLVLLLTASSPNKMLQSAQTSIEMQEWENAARMLDALVSAIDSPAATINYDRGIAHYNLEQFDIAAKAFEDAMASSDDPTLASYSAYNFGNAIYQSTMKSLEGTTSEGETEKAIIAIEEAKEQIVKTIDSYRRSINSNPKDMDARANGELAWKMLQQLDQMQEQMEQEQQQQEDQNKDQQDEESAQEQADNQQNKEEGDSENEEQDKSDHSQSQNKGEQSQDDQEKQESDSSDQQEGEQSQDDQEKQESDSSDQQEGEQSDGNDQQKSSPSDSKDQKEGEQTPDDQKSLQDQNDESQNTNEQHNELNEQPDIDKGELESTQTENENGESDQMNEKVEGQRLTRNEAARLLQLIRDKEQQRRKMLSALKAARRVPVQKDW